MDSNTEILDVLETDNNAIESEAKRSINYIYNKLGLSEPKIAWFNSVFESELVYYLIHKFTREEFIEYFMNNAEVCAKHLCEQIEYNNIYTPSTNSLLNAAEWYLNNGFQINNEYKLRNFILDNIFEYESEANNISIWNTKHPQSLFFMSHSRRCLPKIINFNTIFTITPLAKHIEFVNQNCFCWYPFDEISVLVKSPHKCTTNTLGLLHCEDRPALEWQDGTRLWFLNGTCVPQWVTETPIDVFTQEDILWNTEYGHEIAKKIGTKRLIGMFDTTVIDKHDNYELIELNIEDPEEILQLISGILPKQKYLKMVNPSTGEAHVEGVNPNCETIKEAFAWRNETTDTPVIIT
ncbi:MAG: DUF6745 domain-containing protein [Thermodesulfobacteriota bacterium]